MKYSLEEVKKKSRRINDVENKRLHPFASKFSVYFSWLFINLGMTPNQVTGLFFLTGLIGAFILLKANFLYIIISYALFRLHIIIDISDGEVARFTKKFSINGSYWDSMIHSILYPLYFVTMSVSQYYIYNDVDFLFLGLIGSMVSSSLLSVKNNYYRAMLFNDRQLSSFKKKTDGLPKTGVRFSIFTNIVAIMSFEGFLIGFIIVNYFKNIAFAKGLFIVYILSFSLIVLTKFYQLSTKGYYRTRS